MPITDFTYAAYREFVDLIRTNGYEFADFHNYAEKVKPCIMRHDVDVSIEKAVAFSELEHEIGISSTYFVLLRTDFYNVFSKKNVTALNHIRSLGHEIGLHFDEESLSTGNAVIQDEVKKEARVLSDALGYDTRVVSMHRPSADTLERDYHFDGIKNAYSKHFFKEFKYLSDSRMFWRENGEQIIDGGGYSKLQIVTHPFWYSNEKRTIRDNVLFFANSANRERYQRLSENIRDIDGIIKAEDIQ